MAIDYTELFSDIGKNVKATNLFFDFANSAGLSVPDIDDLLAEIQARYETSDLRQLITGIEARYQSYRDTGSSWASQEADRVQSRMLDRDTVVNELAGADVGDIDRTIREIFRDMIAQSETLNESAIVIGAPVREGVGTGNVLTTSILDGVSEPSPGFGRFLLYDGLESQLAVPSEEMTVTCIADEDSDGTPEGQEIFLWEGQPANNGAFGNLTEGSGISVQMSTAQAAETIANRDLEAWNDNTPTNWSIESGVAGTDVIQEQQASNVHRGTSSMRFVGNGVDVRVIQELADFLVPNQRFFFAFFLKSLGNVTSGTLTVRMESPSGGYIAPPEEETVVPAAVLNAFTQYTLRNFYLTVPSSIPEDLRWVIRWEGAPAGDIFIDSMVLAPVIYANGVGINIMADAVSFVRNDRFTFSVDNAEGVFSAFYRRRFQFQLPADGAGAETIPDTLATA